MHNNFWGSYELLGHATTAAGQIWSMRPTHTTSNGCVISCRLHIFVSFFDLLGIGNVYVVLLWTQWRISISVVLSWLLPSLFHYVSSDKSSSGCSNFLDFNTWMGIQCCLPLHLGLSPRPSFRFSEGLVPRLPRPRGKWSGAKSNFLGLYILPECGKDQWDCNIITYPS